VLELSNPEQNISVAMELCSVLALCFAFLDCVARFLFASMTARILFIGVLNAERNWEQKSICLSDEIN